MFQHTAARRRLIDFATESLTYIHVSTHSRPKAAELSVLNLPPHDGVSTHSRPKAAESADLKTVSGCLVSTHSRPKAAD